ncbi:hypothetical protein AURDEDRAFT_130104 [Auricularia subglabra TFB-10046 SS5]|uniref:Uncharacterized protein n=1 Tax=Auricularia subglabra (strain TFB-10046 / SS5) TaxID=717982 RepID=J0D9C5_AURST|nr:hypothetical protein AURDEDRAFT_130104 [Auricularia subglabra TFB-10046 SS5]
MSTKKVRRKPMLSVHHVHVRGPSDFFITNQQGTKADGGGSAMDVDSDLAKAWEENTSPPPAAPKGGSAPVDGGKDGITTDKPGGAGSDATLSESDSEPEVDYSQLLPLQRGKSGLYRRMLNKFQKASQWSLAHLVIAMLKWVPYRGNKILVPADTPDDLLPHELAALEQTFLLVGEVYDCLFGPLGTKSTSGKRFQYAPTEVKDGTNIRPGLRLKQLKDWDPVKLDKKNMFADQVGALQEIVRLGEGGGEEGDEAIRAAGTPRGKHTIMHVCGKTDWKLRDFDSITIVTDVLYRQDPNAQGPIPTTIKRSDAKREELGEATPPPEDPLPDVDSFTDIKVNDLYDPHLLPGYEQESVMRHQISKVAQLDIRDWNDELLPPWKWREYLAEGALVMVHGKVKLWLPKAEGKAKPAHIYQFVASSIRVVCRAPPPPRPRTPEPSTALAPSTPKADTPAPPAPPTPVTPTPMKQARSAFNSMSFGSPSKKAKLEKK